MSYLTTIPNPTDFLAISQKQLLANYRQIYNTFSRNHVALDSAQKNIGYHTAFTMPVQGSDPTTSATEVALYNKSVSSVNQLFYMPNSSQTPIQMTNSNASVIFDATQLRISTFLPGAFTLYIGYLRDITTGTTVTLTPATNLKYVGIINAMVSEATVNGCVAFPSSSNTFVVNYAGSNPPKLTFWFMAIGQ